MSDKPAYCRDTAFENFRCALAHLESTAGLVTAACAIAQHELVEDTATDVLSKLDKLGRSVVQGITLPTTQTLLAHLHDLLFDVLGLRGNEQQYYDPANSYLPLVLSRRRGIPITLTLIYKAVAERAGLRICGINAPGHFLAGVFEDAGAPEPTLIVDPFYDGKVLTPEEAHSRVVMASGTGLMKQP